jgi:hypothetical protein
MDVRFEWVWVMLVFVWREYISFLIILSWRGASQFRRNHRPFLRGLITVFLFSFKNIIVS